MQMKIQPDSVRRFSYALSDRVPFSGEYYPGLIIPHVMYDMHYPLEFSILLKGRVRTYFTDGTIDCSPGDVTFTGMWEVRGVKTIGRQSRDCFVLIIWPSLLTTLHCPEAPDFDWLAPFTVPPCERPHVPDGQRPAFIAMARRFIAVMNEPIAQRMVWFRLLLMECLLMLSKFWRPTPLPRACRASFHQLNPAIERVFASSRFMSTAEAAQACSMNRIRFSRSFKATMGVSFADFAQRHRLSQAMSQMCSTNEPLKAIARTWGFADESHLHRIFSRHYHCAPAVYREQHAEMHAQSGKAGMLKGPP